MQQVGSSGFQQHHFRSSGRKASVKRESYTPQISRSYSRVTSANANECDNNVFESWLWGKKPLKPDEVFAEGGVTLKLGAGTNSISVQAESIHSVSESSKGCQWTLAQREHSHEDEWATESVPLLLHWHVNWPETAQQGQSVMTPLDIRCNTRVPMSVRQELSDDLLLTWHLLTCRCTSRLLTNVLGELAPPRLHAIALSEPASIDILLRLGNAMNGFSLHRDRIGPSTKLQCDPAFARLLRF